MGCHIEGKQKYVDREGRYIFAFEGNVAAGASPAYNTNLINPKDYKSLWDFLNPKLKGKVSTQPYISYFDILSGPKQWGPEPTAMRRAQIRWP